MAAAVLDDGLGPIEPPPTPTTLKQCITDVTTTLHQIRHKLQTLTSYYIYPNIIPNEVRAYDPRLQILQVRLNDLSILNYDHLACIVDNSDAFASQYLRALVEQSMAAIKGIEVIFFNHYDRALEDRQPFSTLWDTLSYRLRQITELAQYTPSNPRHVRPEDIRPQQIESFCRGAIMLMNFRDKGKVSLVDPRDHTEENQRKLKLFGGTFLNWECPECAYKCRYHVATSNRSNMHTTEEVLEHDDVRVQYRSLFLAKSHIYMPQGDKPSGASGKESKRKSSAAPIIIQTKAKYGCIFCFAAGKTLSLGESSFASAKDIAEHMEEKHKKRPPPSLMLHRFMVAIQGKMFDERGRWDVNFS